jgi:single-strand DNA-binding protein
MNKIFLIGHVGQQPKRTTNGTGVNYSLAVKERTRVNGEWTDKTTWIDIVHWGQNADFAEKWIHKGTKIMIEGRLNITEKTDQDGNKKRFTNVVAEHVELLSKSDGQSNDGQTTGANTGAANESFASSNVGSQSNNISKPEGDDDLPF